MVDAKAHTGELRRFDGKYYKLDFSELQSRTSTAPHRDPGLDRRAAGAAGQPGR